MARKLILVIPMTGVSGLGNSRLVKFPSYSPLATVGYVGGISPFDISIPLWDNGHSGSSIPRFHRL